jgi:hypothetical protein
LRELGFGRDAASGIHSAISTARRRLLS